MPIYEYECDQCGHEFEAIQGFSDKPLKKCEKCGGKVHKLVSQSSFHLKGSGWYVTDYASSKHPGSKPPESKDGASASNGDKAKSTDTKPKSESKTDTKSETKKTDSSKS